MRAPIFPPVIIKAAITSAYSVIAVCTPVTVVLVSLATVAIATFITDVSSVIRNCAAQSVTRTKVAPAIATFLTADPSIRRASLLHHPRIRSPYLWKPTNVRGQHREHLSLARTYVREVDVAAIVGNHFDV